MNPDEPAPRRLCRPRKTQSCRLCGGLIPAGEPCHRWTGFSGNRPFTNHAHPECLELTDGWDESDWETTAPGDLERPRRMSR
jgi:hypothetical protein